MANVVARRNFFRTITTSGRSLSGNAVAFGLDETSNPLKTPLHRYGSIRNYSLAIAREVPKSFPEALTMASSDGSSSNKINYHNATIEHEKYLTTLRKHIPVVCLPPIDRLPDSVFVEDTVVAIGNKAVITNPGHPSRKPEVDSIRVFLEDQLGMEVTDMREAKPSAICDGGDVLYTGRHLFVGISGDRTNRDAVEALADGLGIEAIPVPFRQGKGALHLKSITTHIDDRTLVVPDTDLGRSVFQTLADASGGAYSSTDALWLPEHAGLSCNLVSLPQQRFAMAQLVHEDDARTRGLLQEAAAERSFALEFVTQAEAAKCDGALTCCSVLLDI
jgi:dimethylargininase